MINLRKPIIKLENEKYVKILIRNRIKEFDYKNKVVEIIKILDTEPKVLVKINENTQCFFHSKEIGFI